MPRLFALLMLLMVAALAVGLLVVQSLGGTRADGTYRPRWRMRPGARKSGANGLVHVVRRDELEGVRDALTSAPIDARRELARCNDCLAFYHADSVVALAADHGGRCVGCGGRDIAPARVVDARP